ncbi:MAG: hydrolase, partial [Lachnospiraceae bacterium]|nr:hydrolase [Lachnospiraceae bacterium]
MRIAADTTACLVIDYQEKIVPAMAHKEELIQNSVKLLTGLRILQIPMT